MAGWKIPFALVSLITCADSTADAGLGRHEADSKIYRSEVTAHGFDMDTQKSTARRLIRKEKLPGEADTRTNLELDDSNLGRFLMQTKHAVPQLRAHSLLQGPGLLGSVEDAWKTSLEMLDLYDKNISFDCSVKYGRQMLNNLVADRNAHHVCASGSNSITCFERVPFDVSRYMCSLKNVSISQDGTAAPGCNKNAYDSFVPSEGITEKNIFGDYTHLGGVDFTANGMRCKATVAGKALVQVAADVQNFYEWYGDWVTLWETMAALGWHPKDVDLYLVGKLSGGAKEYARPFDEAWSRMFKSKLHVGSMEQLFGEGTCFQEIYTVPQGSLSTISFHGGRAGSVPCSSPLVMSSALYLQSLFPQPANATKSASKHVTVLQRKGGIRAWDNDVIAIRDIQDVVPKDWKVSGFKPEDYVTFEEQLNVVQNTQVFVGIHGAGMMHVLFLPPMARVVEVFCGDRPQLNHHFRNVEEMGEPFVGEHLFHYYFESTLGRCKIDTKAITKAIAAWEAGPVKE